jgi:3-hydroxybutyryl-CoA dehydrogenase
MSGEKGEAMRRIGVVGGGLMGAGIAEVSARAGHDVVVTEASDEFAQRALARIEGSLVRAEAKGRIRLGDGRARANHS